MNNLLSGILVFIIGYFLFKGTSAKKACFEIDDENSTLRITHGGIEAFFSDSFTFDGVLSIISKRYSTDTYFNLIITDSDDTEYNYFEKVFPGAAIDNITLDTSREIIVTALSMNGHPDFIYDTYLGLIKTFSEPEAFEPEDDFGSPFLDE